MARSEGQRVLRRAVRVLTSLSANSFSTDAQGPLETAAVESGVELELHSERREFLWPGVRRTAPNAAPPAVARLPEPEDALPKVLESFTSASACLRSDSPGEASEIVAYLLEAEIPSEKLISSIHRYPELLLLKLEPLQAQIARFREMGMKKSNVFEMLLSYPEVFGLDFTSEIQPILQFFTGFLGGYVSIGEFIAQVPVVLTYNLDQEIRPKIAFLQSLGCHDTEIIAMMESYPSILCLSLEKSIRPKIDYLLSRLPHMNIKHAILTFPAFLDMSLEAHIKEKIEFFLDVLHVNPEEFAHYLPHFPEIFSCEVEDNIKRKIEFLCLKMDIVQGKRKNMKIVKHRSLGFMACPSLFGLSQSRLLERIEQIHDLIFRNREVLDDLFVKCPLLFGCTVEIEDVERVARSIIDAVDANRRHFLQILQDHPEILMTHPEEMEDIMDAVANEMSLSKMLRVLSNRKQFLDRCYLHRSRRLAT